MALLILRRLNWIFKLNIIFEYLSQGDGNFHTMLLFDPNDPASFEKVHAIGERMALKAIELDGTCTGEHGIGLGMMHLALLLLLILPSYLHDLFPIPGKKKLLIKEHGEDCVSVMKAIKCALDPNNILNPTKIFDW